MTTTSATAPPRPVPLPRGLLACALTACVLLGVAGGAAGQAPPPDGEWVTFRTEHFRVTYPPELEALARQAGVAAERTYAALRAELGEPPRGVIDVLVTDHVDYTNGVANLFPSSRITVYARPPTSMPQLAWSGDWIELVVAHELVHIFHLTESGPVGRAVRSVLGRVPMIWPIFPVPGSPTWNVEGLATYYESRLTGSGRVPGSFHDMVIRTAALEDRIPALDELSAPSPVWPGGQRSYGYGSRLMAHVTDRFGPEAHGAIVEATGRSIRPTFLFFDHVAGAAVGEDFDAIYDDWRQLATEAAHDRAARIRAAGLTATEPVAGRGPYAAAPRVSPDGRLLSFGAHDLRSDAATRVVELGTGAVRTVGRRNQAGGMLGPAAWLPAGKGMVVAQLELEGRYRAFSDLWHMDLEGRERRLTRGERMAQPDVAPDGRSVAAVRSRAGGLQLVIHDLETGETRVLLDAAHGDAHDSPRWSPDGRRLAVGRDIDGRVDIAVVDVETGALTPLTDDEALDLMPAWSPDGEWVVWWSDRTGVPNILAARAPAAPAATVDGGSEGAPAGGGEDGGGTVRGDPVVVHQVTNLLTGGFDPEVSPDGGTLYLSVYHHDGWRIEAVPFDPGEWREAPANVMRRGEGLLDRTDAGGGGAEAPSSPYSPWKTVRPYYWLPEYTAHGGAGGSLSFLGARTHGRDLVGRHAWAASASVDPGSGRWQAAGAWGYRGLGIADLQMSARRRWRYVTEVPVSDGQETIWERSDRVAADLVFWRSRWRSVSWLRAGMDAEWREREAHDLSAAELEAEGWVLRPLPTLVGVSAGPGYSSARSHPFSISPQDGVSASFGLGRWWDAATGARAYDEIIGRGSGYLGLNLGGFADHVLAIRAAGMARAGDASPARSIGGAPGTLLPAGLEEVLGTGVGSPSFFPVRGFDSGARAGTRAWTGSAEWRFPLHLRNAPDRVLGFSLTALSGTLFGDAGHAWCPTDGPELEGCSEAGDGPLVSAGAELGIDFGAFHNERVIVRLGLARPIRGPGGAPSFYVAMGRAF